MQLWCGGVGTFILISCSLVDAVEGSALFKRTCQVFRGIGTADPFIDKEHG